MSILNSLSRTESGGNFAAQNNEVGSSGKSGHFGRLQFGHDRLTDATRAGVLPQGTTPEQFMADPELQQRVESWHLSDLASQAERMGLTQYIGQEVGGVPITMDSIVAMGHLGGMGGASKFLRSGGQHNPADSFGTSLADYARTHGSASGQPAPQPPRQVTPQQQNTLTQPQSAPENALSDNQQRMAMMQQFMPQQNALSAAAFQSNTAPRQVLGFGQGQSPFT